VVIWPGLLPLRGGCLCGGAGLPGPGLAGAVALGADARGGQGWEDGGGLPV